MRQASAKVWVGGTAALAVLLLAAAWFLAIDPVVARASTDTAAAQQQRDQNDLLELEIAKLEEQSTHLEEYRAELAALRTQLPPTSDPASIGRELDALATTAGLTLTALQPSVPEAFVPAAAAASGVTADSAASDGAAQGSVTTDSAAAAPTEAVAGFFRVPLSVTTVGSYEASVAFLRSVQESSSRLYLVSSISATTQDDQGASGGRPATVDGDVELVLTGAAFVLTDPTAAPTEPAEEALPVPADQANPFLPGR